MKRNLITILLCFSSVFILNAQEKFNLSKFSRVNDLSIETGSLNKIEKSVPSYRTDNKMIMSNRQIKAILLEETFEGPNLPDGWSVIGLGPTNWSISSSNYSGGTAPELRFSWTPSFTGTSYFMSPVINTTGYTDLTLEFNHMLNNFTSQSQPKIIGVATTIDGGANWLEVWSQVLTNDDILAEVQNLIINNAHVGNANFQFAFFFTGYSFDIDYWYIDNVSLGQPEPHDLGITAISPSFVVSGGTVSPQVTVKNFGSNTETVWSVSLTTTDYSSVLNNPGTIAPGESMVLAFPDWSPADGTYTLTATVNVANDTYAENDVMEITTDVAGYSIAYVGNTTSLTYSEIDLTSGTTTPVGTINTTPFPMAEEFNGTAIYRINDDMTIGTVDPVGNFTTLGTLSGVTGTPTGIAYDWDNDIMYVLVLDASNLPQLCTLNMSTYALTLVGTGASGMIIGIDFAEDGFLYGPSLDDDNLYKINPLDGSVSIIGPVGRDLNYGQDVSFDGQLGIMYSCTVGALYDFGYYNLQTGEFFPIAGTNGEQIGTMCITKTPYPSYFVNFTVTSGGNPIEGAVITIGQKVLITDVNGTVSRKFYDGNYDFTVEKFGYELYPGSFTVEGVDQDIDVALIQLAGYDVTFNFDNINGDPLDADVNIIYNNTEVFQGTASAGTITFNNVPVGNYLYNVQFEGYEPLTGEVLDVVDQDVYLDVTLIEIIEPVVALTAEVVANDVTLNWFEPGHSFITPQWIHWDDGTNFDAIGTGAAADFDVAIRFVPTDMTEFDGGVISKVIFFPNEASASYTIKIWQGANAANLIYSEAVASPIIGTMNEYVLATEVPFDINDELWIGFNVNTSTGYPAGCDAGPAYVGFGDMIYFGGVWASMMTAYGLNYNWNIQGWVDAPGAKGFLGTYNVYLDDVLQTVTPISEMTYTFNDLAIGSYVGAVTALYETGESDPLTVDFTIETIAVDQLTSGIVVYPNPSNGFFNIQVDDIMNLEVTDISGKVILSQPVNKSARIQLNNTGVYFLKFSNDEGFNIQRIVVQ
jgi:hypothetical protein